jgi:hypothetical protein
MEHPTTKLETGKNGVPLVFELKDPSLLDSLNEGSLRSMLTVIANALPLDATLLSHIFQDKVLPARKAKAEANAALAEAIEQAEMKAAAELERAEAVIEQKEAEKEQAMAPHLAKISEKEAKLEAAHEAAGKACAKAGFSYDPENPSAAKPTAIHLLTTSEAAADMGLPFDNDQGGKLTKIASTLGSIVIGILVGVSLGIVAGILHPDRLTNQFGLTAMAACVGTALTLFMRYGVTAAFRTAAQATYMEQGRANKAVKYAAALAAVVALFGFDVFVEREGVLKLAKSANMFAALSGKAAQPQNELIYVLVAAVVTAGYFVFSGYEGYLKGRKMSVVQRSEAFIEKVHREAHDNAAKTPEAQAAMDAVAAVLAAKAQLALAEEKAAKKEAVLNARIMDAKRNAAAVLPKPPAHVQYDYDEACTTLAASEAEFAAKLAQAIEKYQKFFGPKSTFVPASLFQRIISVFFPGFFKLKAELPS